MDPLGIKGRAGINYDDGCFESAVRTVAGKRQNRCCFLSVNGFVANVTLITGHRLTEAKYAPRTPATGHWQPATFLLFDELEKPTPSNLIHKARVPVNR